MAGKKQLLFSKCLFHREKISQPFHEFNIQNILVTIFTKSHNTVITTNTESHIDAKLAQICKTQAWFQTWEIIYIDPKKDQKTLISYTTWYYISITATFTSICITWDHTKTTALSKLEAEKEDRSVSAGKGMQTAMQGWMIMTHVFMQTMALLSWSYSTVSISAWLKKMSLSTVQK